ncbi:MAG: DUF115 domain-containing protein [Lachnospiraceae bacterium]|nr:DUF115 domain-containing protein [Lachnospiraceae bacterium]
MKYVIWGCGKRGKGLAILLGKDLVTAFIDSNAELKGASFLDIPVIEYSDYLCQNMHELIIIAVKGHEKSIGERLNKDNIPWIAMDTVEYISILNQLRLGIEKILEKDDPDGEDIIYGYNVYGAYLYELLKLHNRKCSFVLQDDLSDYLRELIEKELPVNNNDGLKGKKVERVFWATPDTEKDWLKQDCVKQTNIYEIYKEFDIFYNPELVRFHNIHKGKRCFIIANGPSLRMDDLDTLKQHGEICMAVNGIFKAFDMTEWRPDYYFICDLFGLLQWKKDILQMDVKEKFISDTGWYLDEKEVAGNIHIVHDYMKYCDTELPKFSDDFSKCAYWGGSVIYDGPLQMAVYMGFREIYMLGADCTVETSRKKQHFVENYEDDKFSKSFGLNTQQLFKGYEAARKYCEQHGIRLCNATRGGALEVLERVSFDSLF